MLQFHWAGGGLKGVLPKLKGARPEGLAITHISAGLNWELLNAVFPRTGKEITPIAIAKINFKKTLRLLLVAFGARGGIQFQMLGFASLSSISEMGDLSRLGSGERNPSRASGGTETREGRVSGIERVIGPG
jgi:hypothetical protein